MTSIRYDKRKFPDVPHYSRTIEILHEDEHGLWAFGSRGGPIMRGDEVLFESDWETVMVFPPDDWWNAIFTRRDDGLEIYVDIATPARLVDGAISFIDLDLDVYRSPAGAVQVWDRDEFEARKASYPPELASAAERATHLVVEALEVGAEPFGLAHRRFTDPLGVAARSFGDFA